MFDNLIHHHIYSGELSPGPTSLAYDYILAGNGVFIHAENRFVSACIPVQTMTIRGLPNLKPKVQLKQGRLPGSLLAAIVSDAKQARDLSGRLVEALYHIEQKNDVASVIKPQQTASAVRVESTSGANPNIILDIHSHGKMDAYFSETDNADEQGLRFYGVLGHVDQDKPTLVLRLGVYGVWVSVEVEALFSADALECCSVHLR